MENGDEHDTSMTHGRSSLTLPNQCYIFRNVNHCRLPAELRKPGHLPLSEWRAASRQASVIVGFVMCGRRERSDSAGMSVSRPGGRR